MHQARNLTWKLWRLSWRDRFLLHEAVFWLTLASLAIAVLPFAHLGWLASTPMGGGALPHQRRLVETSRVRWAIVACARWVPWRAVCFQQGLAAHFMLRRRCIRSVLYYGAAPDDRFGLSAHVWVCAGDVNVVGGEIASRYAVLATFPPEGRNTDSRELS